MSNVKREKEIADIDNEINEINANTVDEESFNSERTSFKRSFLFLILEAIIPGLCLWLFSGYDIVFDFVPQYSVGINVAVGIATIFITILLTLIGWLLKWHGYDQFTYCIALITTVFAFYITGYWWNGLNKFIIRFLIAFAALVISAMIATMLSFYLRNLQLKIKKKQEEKS